MSSNAFIVENGINTCYIDSLLMALFYKNSFIAQNLLSYDPSDSIYIYLQELIREHFVEKVKRNISVLGEDINIIRNFANACGWRKEDDLFDQQDVNEFYTFLMNAFNGTLIEIQRESITEGLSNKDDYGKVEKIPFISLQVHESESLTSVKSLLDKWFSDNYSVVEREVIDENGLKKKINVNVLNLYRIVNIPLFVGLSINRFNNDGVRIQTKVDIQKKIKLLKDMGSYDDTKWEIQSVICHRGETIKSGHYYALINNNDKWYIFDDLTVPSLKEVSINKNDSNEDNHSNEDDHSLGKSDVANEILEENEVSMANHKFIEMIQRECVFLFYAKNSLML
jgi:uncharacterized UBP type Zn finger protein